MCLARGTVRTRRDEGNSSNSSNNSVESQKRRETRMHARRVVEPHVDDISSCAHVRTHTTFFHLPTYRPTTGPSITARGRGTILAHGGSTCSNPRAAARSRGQTGRIFAFDPLPSSFATSLPSYLILLEDLGYFLSPMAKEGKPRLARGYRNEKSRQSLKILG